MDNTSQQEPINVVITATFPRYFQLFTGLEPGTVVPMWLGTIHYPKVLCPLTNATLTEAYDVDFWPNSEGECFVQSPFGYEKTFIGLDDQTFKHFCSVGYVKLSPGDYALCP